LNYDTEPRKIILEDVLEYMTYLAYRLFIESYCVLG